MQRLQMPYNPAKLQTHKMEHKTQARNKQSAPWENGATLCKNLFDDSIREGVSYPLHTNAPATQTTPAPSAVPISALALAPHPNLQAV